MHNHVVVTIKVGRCGSGSLSSLEGLPQIRLSYDWKSMYMYQLACKMLSLLFYSLLVVPCVESEDKERFQDMWSLDLTINKLQIHHESIDG
jgi:hypothetical protein